MVAKCIAQDTQFPINPPGETVILRPPVDILCSYHYFKDVDMDLIHSWGTSIIGDSGAFSAMSAGAQIDRDKFHEWCSQYSDSLFWAASLDVIGNEKQTWNNWRAAERDGLSLVPTIHYGADPKAMDRYVQSGASLIGLGGMVPFSNEKDRLMRWCLSMHRYARDNHPDVRFHGWGISHQYLVDNLPWWSTDSSGFASCFRFGTLKLWVPELHCFKSVSLNGKQLGKYADTLRKHYGISWRKIAVSTPSTRRDLGRVAILSIQLYNEWLKKRQLVSPPKLLLPKGETGSGKLQHVAMITSGQGEAITPAGGGNPKRTGGPVLSVALGVDTQLAYLLPPHSMDLHRLLLWAHPLCNL